MSTDLFISFNEYFSVSLNCLFVSHILQNYLNFINVALENVLSNSSLLPTFSCVMY